jgi:Spy/CpxP family protein refolding chaperone
MKLPLVLAVALVASGPALAQHQRHGPAASPYAEMMKRRIKALSDTEMADLRAGRGMGLALPAELNGYPGPLHVLELADQLRLTADQKDVVTRQIADMKRESIDLGEKLIQAEAALDTLFASSQADETRLHAAVMNAGQARAMVRLAHLKFHLATKAVLSSEQADAYMKLRGYGGPH